MDVQSALYSLLLFFLITISCKAKSDFDIEIIGKVKNLPEGIVYLVDAHDYKKILDSTVAQKGNFKFSIKVPQSFTPSMVSLYYKDSLSRLLPLLYSVDKSSRNFETAFYLEKGKAFVAGDIKSPQKTIMEAGNETQLMYRYKESFGYLDNSMDSVLRKTTITKYKQILKKYPDSYYLLQCLSNYRVSYTAEEIKSLFNLFSDKLQNSSIGTTISSYIFEAVDVSKPYPLFTVYDTSNLKHQILGSKAKVTMLVFWASWCTPCRKEIPVLKQLNNEFRSNGLLIESISIDKDISLWKKALREESMDWGQYWANDSTINKLESVFRFSSIPTIVFVNSDRLKIKIFNRYEDSTTLYSKYKELIQPELNR